MSSLNAYMYRTCTLESPSGTDHIIIIDCLILYRTSSTQPANPDINVSEETTDVTLRLAIVYQGSRSIPFPALLKYGYPMMHNIVQ